MITIFVYEREIYMGLKRLHSILFLSFILLLLSACGGEETSSNESDASTDTNSEERKSLTMLFSFASSSIDPHQDFMGVRAGIAETLVKIDENLEIQPWLAEEYEQVDEKTWKFKIREEVTFHDGTPVDAEAVKASFERAVEENAAVASALKIESIEADGMEVTFTNEEPYPAFVSELVHTNASIIKTDADNISEHPIATGPFKVESFISESEINLERYEEYWDTPAKLNEVTIKFNSDANVRALSLQSGEADIAYHLPPEALDPIESSNKHRVESVPSLRVHFLLYNQASESLQDNRVRKALDLIVNRDVMVEEIMNEHATAASGPFNPDFPFAGDSLTVNYDPEQAEALLEEAGYTKNDQENLEKDGKELSLTIATYQGRPELPLMAQYFQAEAANLGVKVDIVTIEDIDSYLFEKQDEWDIATYSNLTAPRGDGGYFLNVAYLPNGGLNPGQINIEKLNELTHQINRTADPETRNELKKQAVSVIQEEVPHSFLLHPHIIVGVNERVKNWKPGSEEYYLITNTLDVE